MKQIQDVAFASECKIRDFYSEQMPKLRPAELVVMREATFQNWPLRADLRTVDQSNVLREWEFKLRADYSSLGQILTYTALIREQLNFERDVQGVIAAFEIPEHLVKAIRINNLNIEMVVLPPWMAQAGNIPILASNASPVDVPRIPRIADATKPIC